MGFIGSLICGCLLYDFIVLPTFDCVLLGVYPFVVYHVVDICVCVLHEFYGLVDIWFCVAWCYRVVDILVCIACVIVFWIFECVAWFYRCVDIWLCVAFHLAIC